VAVNTSQQIKYDYDGDYNHKFFFKAAEAYYFLSRMPYNLTKGNMPKSESKVAIDACAYDTSD